MFFFAGVYRFCKCGIGVNECLFGSIPISEIAIKQSQRRNLELNFI
jgi:hypothetical protein